jgi:hypothetical protein
MFNHSDRWLMIRVRNPMELINQWTLHLAQGTDHLNIMSFKRASLCRHNKRLSKPMKFYNIILFQGLFLFQNYRKENYKRALNITSAGNPLI